ncbi:DUF2147 domain-containing protein [Flavobacterium sp.]|jgi:uncharacterized protein (DUF2147 family)|uniref:DUF2147 domain-containing protein n=1 Tax=Flavobacterium sp. TaxID=239 RepID=UPI002A8300AB|nr:DUF2147 domain-containing protein [Flavobacterium sp.]
MKSKLFTITLLLLCITSFSQNSIVGKWKTFDDKTDEAKSIVEIFKIGTEYYGKITTVLNKAEKDKVCIYCKGNDKNKPIEGLVIIKKLTKDGDIYTNGTITDPENGKTYTSKIWLDDENNDLLNVRGYIGFFYRTQQWKRI